MPVEPCPKCQYRLEYQDNNVCPCCGFDINAFQKFLSQVNERIRTLKDLLGEGFLPDEIELYTDYNRPIERALKKIVIWYLNDQNLKCNMEIDRIDRLIEDLVLLLDRDIKVYEEVRERMVLANNIADFYGSRFEAYVCASLVSKNVDFIVRESPDIEVKNEEGKNIYIECTSRRTPKKSEDIHEKIVYKATKDKSSKSYADMDTALFMDITNVLNRYGQTKEGKNKYEQYGYTICKNEMEQKFEEEMGNLNFGSVVTFSFIYDLDKDRIRRVYSRYDHKEARVELLEALDRWYPKNTESGDVPRGAVPTEG